MVQSYSQTSFNEVTNWKLRVRIMIKVNMIWYETGNCYRTNRTVRSRVVYVSEVGLPHQLDESVISSLPNMKAAFTYPGSY